MVNNEAISLYQPEDSCIYLYIYGKYFGYFQKPHAPQKPIQNFCESSRHRTGDIGMMKYRCADN